MAGIQYAGEYNLDEATLITSSGLSVDLRDSIFQVDIFEELNKFSISGSITVFDTNNILTKGQVNGQDYLLLKITTPGIENFAKIDYSKNALCIYRIGQRFDTSKNSEVFELSFCSPEMLLNKRLRISKSYTDTNSNIIKKLLKDKTLLNVKKQITLEPTLDTRKYVVPNLHPFDFIAQLMRDSRSAIFEGSPHYYFYETTQGFHFRTLQSLYNQDVSMEYNDGDVGLLEGGTSKTVNVEEEFKRVINFSISSNADQLLNVMGGMLGANTIKYNSYNKSYEKINHSYFDNFKDFSHINGENRNLDNPIYTESEIDENGNNLGSFTNSKIHLHPVHTDIDGRDATFYNYNTSSYSYSENHTSKNILYRKSKLFELESAISATMKVNGYCMQEVGQIVNLNRPDSGGELDAEYSGKFLVYKLRHTFRQADRKHEVIMSLVKDSSTGKEDGPNRIPKSSGGALFELTS
jgi:hypothetical protein|tara:strand:- start:7351 stop:8745 length:1395 start_codon:yes stop_codon:yes gene_type:complete